MLSDTNSPFPPAYRFSIIMSRGDAERLAVRSSMTASASPTSMLSELAACIAQTRSAKLAALSL